MTPNQIIDIVCKALELDVNKLKTKTSVKEYVHGRFIICYLIRKQLNLSCSERVKKELSNEYSYAAIAVLLGRILKSGEGDHPFALNGEFICTQLLKIKDKEFCAKFNVVICEIAKKINTLDQCHGSI